MRRALISKHGRKNCNDFAGFDTSYNSLNTSIDMQKKFLEGIDENLGKVVAYKDFLTLKIEEFKQKGLETTDETEKMKYDMFNSSCGIFSIKSRSVDRKS